MNLFPSRVIPKISTGIRMVPGVVFLYSGVAKIAEPAEFATIVSEYQLLPPPLVVANAFIFRWIEAVCGLALVVGRLDKGAALLVILMMVVFIGVTVYNGYRGLNIACGCFSLSATTPSNMTSNILRDLCLLAAGAWVLACPADHFVKIA